VPGHVLELTPSALTAAGHPSPGCRVCWRSRPTATSCTSSSTTWRAQTQLEAALAAGGIRHDALREIQMRMEEAYISLVRRQAGVARLSGGRSSGEKAG